MVKAKRNSRHSSRSTGKDIRDPQVSDTPNNALNSADDFTEEFIAEPTDDNIDELETGEVSVPPHTKLSAQRILLLILLGAVVGLFSGVLGIGGGTIIVPALVMMGLSQRVAAATSLAAIIPTSISGVISYSISGNVEWTAAILLIVGVLVGSQVGSWLLSRLSEVFLRWFFVAFMLFMAVLEFTTVPSRDQSVSYSIGTYILLVLFGFVMGALSGLLGIGGGAIAVPALPILFGASDLIARGTSLLAMFPGAVAGTIANFRRGVVHLSSGMLIGVVAAITTPVGTWIARSITPQTGAIIFGTYLIVVVIRSAVAALKVSRKEAE